MGNILFVAADPKLKKREWRNKLLAIGAGLIALAVAGHFIYPSIVRFIYEK